MHTSIVVRVPFDGSYQPPALEEGEIVPLQYIQYRPKGAAT